MSPVSIFALLRNAISSVVVFQLLPVPHRRQSEILASIEGITDFRRIRELIETSSSDRLVPERNIASRSSCRSAQLWDTMRRECRTSSVTWLNATPPRTSTCSYRSLRPDVRDFWSSFSALSTYRCVPNRWLSCRIYAEAMCIYIWNM
jgi:hypothetical protein